MFMWSQRTAPNEQGEPLPSLHKKEGPDPTTSENMGQAVNTQKDAGIQNKAHYQNHGLDLGADNQSKHVPAPPLTQSGTF
jgi:hypothetical protein